MRKTSFKIFFSGCKVNQYDAGLMERKLMLAGIKNNESGFVYAIIYSCAVTQKAINKCLRLINKLRQENPKVKIVITGCLTQISSDKIKALKPNKIYKLNEQEKLVKYISGSCQKFESPCLSSQFDRARYFLKVQDGCRQFCSYCIIPHTRGGLKSRNIDLVIEEAKEAVLSGFEEIVLTGIHLGMYGVDLPDKINLAELVEKIIKIKDIGRIRISSVEISEIDKKLIKMIGEENKICRHLHIPLQSGSSAILEKMNRPYTMREFRNKIKIIRKIVPRMAITTDIIVGFPGETDDDFNKTKKVVKEMEFSRLHVFPFSAHEQVPAAKFKGQVNEVVKRKRARELREIGYALAREERKELLTNELEILIEQINKDKIKGKTEFYFDIDFLRKDIINGEIKKGRLVKVKLT